MGCCSTQCKKWSECQKSLEGGNCIDWANYGWGTLSANRENEIHYECGECGQYAMFVPIIKEK